MEHTGIFWYIIPLGVCCTFRYVVILVDNCNGNSPCALGIKQSLITWLKKIITFGFQLFINQNDKMINFEFFLSCHFKCCSKLFLYNNVLCFGRLRTWNTCNRKQTYVRQILLHCNDKEVEMWNFLKQHTAEIHRWYWNSGDKKI